MSESLTVTAQAAEPPPPQQPQPVQDTLIAAALASALAGAAVTVDAVLAYAGLSAMLRAAGIERLAMRKAIEVIMSMPPDRQGFYGAATARMARMNLLRRAQFAVSAGRRLTGDLREARSRGIPLAQALAGGVLRERRYFGQHLEAIWQRSKAGAQADSAAMTYGRLLGWHTVIDARTSAECRAASGRNFLVDKMPAIGYPGAVHPHCRCYPGKPWPGGRMLPSER